MLTKKQLMTLNFIKQYFAVNHISPTASEIAEGIGITSTGVVYRYLKALSDLGEIELIPNKRRNIRLLGEEISDEYEVQLPILGSIAAGSPIEAVTTHRSSLPVLDFKSIVEGNRFALKVKGDSMIGDAIWDGDYVICEYCQDFRNGKIMVVIVDGEEVTLKRIQKNTDGSVSLIPSNPDMNAMVFDASRVMVQGCYVGLLRLN